MVGTIYIHSQSELITDFSLLPDKKGKKIAQCTNSVKRQRRKIILNNNNFSIIYSFF